MKARYVQRGESIDFTPTEDIAAGDVVRLGKLLGIAKLDIKSGTLGALALTGVYELAKDASIEFAAGELVAFDTANGKAVKAGTDGSTPFGYAVATYGNGTLTALARLAQGLG